VWAGERPVVLGGPRQLTLLGFLLLNANRAVAADTITERVWGSSPASANRLQMAVARLRHVLEPLAILDDQLIRTVSGGYMIAVAAGQLDADAFESSVRDAGEALEADDPERAATLATWGLALWRGPAYAELAFTDFALPEIRRLDELRLVALETRVEADLQRGRHAQIVGELTPMVARDPTRERLVGQLMLALYRSQQQTAALDVYQRTRAMLSDQLGLEPGPALASLQQRILEHDPALVSADREGPSGVARDSGGHMADVGHASPREMQRAPAPSTAILGREREIEAVCGLLRRADVRLVTLVGPGGVGKTRLALALAHEMEQTHPAAVCWVELASVGQASDVADALARGLDVVRQPGETGLEATRRFLSARRMLLVIDNFEHVLDASGAMGDLLAACPALTILVTSREALDLSGEHRVIVAPLAPPLVPQRATVAELEAAPATELFIAAARRHDAAFALDPGQAPAVAELCARLDGLPLALELAAARVGLLGVQELAAELDAAVEGAPRTARDIPDRHRTLAATIDWSHALLDEAQQGAFAAFAVFAGGGTLDAVEAVTTAPRHVLQALIAKSVIQRRSQPDGSTRLTMLETVRQYAAARLKDRPERGAVRRRHFEVYERVAAAAAGRLNTHDDAAALGALDTEIDNLTGALRWATRHAPGDALRLARYLGLYWDVRGDASGIGYLDAVLSADGDDGDPGDRGWVLFLRAHMRGARHEHKEAREDAERAVDLLNDVGDAIGLADAYSCLAYLASSLGDGPEVERNFREAAYQHAQRSGDDRTIGAALGRLALTRPRGERESDLERASELLTRVGDDRSLAAIWLTGAYVALLEDCPAESIAYSEIALAAAERSGSVPNMMLVMGNVGLAHLFLREVPTARSAFMRQLTLCLGQSFQFGADEGLAGLAAVAAAENDPETAATLLGASSALGYPLPADQAVHDRLEREFFAQVRTACGPQRWRRAERAGAALSYDAAIRAALQPQTAEAPSEPSPGDGASAEVLGATGGSRASSPSRR
jgi:predicted ATPase/DNA-binding SARP family transcriptional activator